MVLVTGNAGSDMICVSLTQNLIREQSISLAICSRRLCVAKRHFSSAQAKKAGLFSQPH